MKRREFLVTCAALGIVSASARVGAREFRRDLVEAAFGRDGGPAEFAQGKPATPAVAPADAWPQFRGSYALTGISATTIAPAPKLAWAWEGGEAFDSSPAIVDGVVYAGTATGELIAVGLADG